MNERDVQDRSAAYYLVRYAGYGRKYHADLVHDLLREASGSVLDVGCGTGFAAEVRPDLSIMGIDISPGMLAHHRGRHAEMDVCAMTFPGQTFDFLLCRSLLHHLPDHRRGLAEMHRVLKSGGKIAFLETNHSWLAAKIRAWKQRTDRFSTYHHSFHAADLVADITRWFLIDKVAYVGFLSYPCFGFPDIIPIARYLPFKWISYSLLQGVDACLSRVPGVRRLSWAILIRAHKA